MKDKTVTIIVFCMLLSIITTPVLAKVFTNKVNQYEVYKNQIFDDNENVENLEPMLKPWARVWAGMTFDDKHEKVILYGASFDRITWTYDIDINRWTNRYALFRPPEITCCHEIIYNNKHDKSILFGGGHGRPYYDDVTWVYDYEPNRWRRMSPYPEPSPRYNFGMAYDSNYDKTIIFGGEGGMQNYEDTWSYDYVSNTWTNMSPAIHPVHRWGTQMVYLSNHNLVMMFGGCSHPPYVYHDDTWFYDYGTNTWTRKYQYIYPEGRMGHFMAYNSKHDKVVLFGGAGSGMSHHFDDTWVYDYSSNTWTNMNPATYPTERYWGGMTYDSKHDKIILFAGMGVKDDPNVNQALDDLWIYDYETNTWNEIHPKIKSFPQYSITQLIIKKLPIFDLFDSCFTYSGVM
jgi:N-acetylneuraminic acid mutarotase